MLFFPCCVCHKHHQHPCYHMLSLEFQCTVAIKNHFNTVFHVKRAINLQWKRLWPIDYKLFYPMYIHLPFVTFSFVTSFFPFLTCHFASKTLFIWLTCDCIIWLLATYSSDKQLPTKHFLLSGCIPILFCHLHITMRTDFFSNSNEILLHHIFATEHVFLECIRVSFHRPKPMKSSVTWFNSLPLEQHEYTPAFS